MKPLRLLLAAATCGALLAAAAPALAVDPHHGDHAYRADRLARYYAAQRPWHGPYAYTQYGTAVALVVPPTADMHTSYAWGVSQSEMIPIYHQFYRDYPGPALGGGAGFLPTPYWPSHTDQFGVYPVRGPW